MGIIDALAVDEEAFSNLMHNAMAECQEDRTGPVIERSSLVKLNRQRNEPVDVCIVSVTNADRHEHSNPALSHTLDLKLRIER